MRSAARASATGSETTGWRRGLGLARRHRGLLFAREAVELGALARPCAAPPAAPAPPL